jgi:uncharacterized protein (TIGR02996 family)
MRTFRFRDGKSDKFWSVGVEGNRLTVTFGPTGTAGQTKVKEFKDEAAARREEEKLICQKTAKGYAEAAAPAAPSPMRQALEEALADDPDDLASHMAYADWLAEQGDPRGEFIQTQLALERADLPAAERRRLQKREKELLAAHEREWLGDLAPFLVEGKAVWPEGEDWEEVEYQYQFARGWLDSLQANGLSMDCAAAVAGAPQLRLLRRLVIEDWYYEQEPTAEMRRRYRIPERSGFPALYPLLRASNLGNVWMFQLGERVEGSITRWGNARRGYHYSVASRCYTRGNAAADLVKKMPRLEELRLFADEVDTRKLFGLKTLTYLRILQVYHCWEYPLEVLARNAALGNLTHLLLHPKARGSWARNLEAPYIRREGVRVLLRSPHLKSLTHLQLRLTDIGDAGCEEIVRSGILKRLKVLDLRHGTVTDAGAATLASCPDLANLGRLELSRNRLRREGERALLGVLGTRLNAQYQQTGREEPDQYLYEGDYE